MNDIFDEMQRMSEEMNRIFSRFSGEMPMVEHKGRQKGRELMRYRPALTNLYETDKAVIGEFELPGVEKGDIELNVTDKEIEIKVDKKAEKELKEKKKGFYSYESRSHSFYRRMPLPKEVKSDETLATYKNGVLKVVMPKKNRGEKKKNRIDVK